MQLSPKIRRCTKCDSYFQTIHRYSKICYGCKGSKQLALAHCPHCNYLQISTAVSRFVCKNCRHSPLPKNAKVVFASDNVKEIVGYINQLRKSNPSEDKGKIEKAPVIVGEIS
ncbi:hypothetical protein J4210_05630 [Candidatus Woesearchaeota archaeon]|nr:hypothetical protein [Candidatus Woesearchaeota archaeon]